MKVVFLVILGAVLACASGISGSSKVEKDRTITKVVKLLQKMLTKSKEDADADRLLYAKYKCYVDKNEVEKKASIKTLGETIELLGSQIAGLQADNGVLSTQLAALEREMTGNKDAQSTATTIRDNSKKAFDSMEEDLVKAIGQMTEAVDVLSSIKLTQNSVSVHKKESVLLSLGTKVTKDLTAVAGLLPAEERQAVESFLQSPLSAAHMAKGDAIVQVLEKLKTTFEGNLKNAQDSEAAEKKAFDATIETLEKSWTTMDTTKTEKTAKLGENSQELSDKAGQLEAAEQQKKDDEEFLEKLLEGAATKAKNYEERNMLRANEDAAISEAIAILNSDAAFDTFGENKATRDGATSFLQFRQLRGGAAQEQAYSVLVNAHSMRLARVATGLRAGHAFTTVMEEIGKMKTLISEEGAADQENFDWCTTEEANNDKDLESKKSQIKILNGEIEALETTIGFPDQKTGLIFSISEKEIALVENQKNQVDITDTRKKENVEYNKNVMDLAEAEDILGKAIKVLDRYYKQLAKQSKDSTNLLQEDPTPPELYGDFEGQSTEGNKAIEMLKFILGETTKEHEEADKTEKTALSDFETEMGSVEDMSGLKGAEKQMQEDLVKLKADLAQARKDLLEKKADHKDTTAAKEAIEKYMAEIKPGCDFIKDNKDDRDANRATEKAALEKAEGLLKDTPAYKKAVAKQEDKCAGDCKLDTTSLKCKVCMSGDSKEKYCGKHAGTPGCV